MKSIITFCLLCVGLMAYSQDERKFNLGLISIDKPQPLYVVDGIKVPSTQPIGEKKTWGEVLNLYSDKFESISILSGKEATDKYGVEGLNGVVLITTKLYDKNEPIYIVDGAITRNVSLLNPDDIQSIEVLKDKAETSKYVMGENGVVLITTKAKNK